MGSLARLALLDAAVREAGEAVLITTADLDLPGPRIVFANPAACRLTGYAADELLGRTPRLLQGPKTDRALMDRLRAALARGEPFAGQAVNYRKDGSEYVVDWQITPVRAGGLVAGGAEAGGVETNGPVTHFVALQRDVTARVQADDERAALLASAERARAEAEAANRAKGEFLAVMSHELRTPLNAIGGYVELLQLGLRGPVTADQRTDLERVQRAQRRLLSLINDVLNYAKLEAGHVEYDLRPVDLRDVVADVTPLVEPLLAAKGLVLDVRLPEGPCVVWTDREKLGQVLVNLLSNATKFTDARHPATGSPGRVTVAVATRRGAAADAVFLRVTDTGRGIPRDKQATIFEPFVQVHTGYARPGEGTGLGLAISRDLARGMGGDLRVRNVDGAGASFTVVLRRVSRGDSPRGDGTSADGTLADGTLTDRRSEQERRSDLERRHDAS